MIGCIGVCPGSAINTEASIGADFGNGGGTTSITNAVTKGRICIHIGSTKGTGAIAKGIGCRGIGLGSTEVGGGKDWCIINRRHIDRLGIGIQAGIDSTVGNTSRILYLKANRGVAIAIGVHCWCVD